MKNNKQNIVTAILVTFFVTFAATIALAAADVAKAPPPAASTPADGKAAPAPTVAELQTKLDAANKEIESLKAQIQTQGTTIQVLMDQRAKLANDLLNTEIVARLSAPAKKAP